MSEANKIVDLLEAAIRAESLRQKTIASNMANATTPGYRRVDVRFEELLSKALDTSGPLNLQDIEAEIFAPHDTPVKGNGNDVHMEGEVGQLVKNSLQHTAYIRLLKKKFSQIQQAINIRG
jgi:flagellar basal-body rod protein FlgB